MRSLISYIDDGLTQDSLNSAVGVDNADDMDANALANSDPWSSSTDSPAVVVVAVSFPVAASVAVDGPVVAVVAVDEPVVVVVVAAGHWVVVHEKYKHGVPLELTALAAAAAAAAASILFPLDPCSAIETPGLALGLEAHLPVLPISNAASDAQKAPEHAIPSPLRFWK